MRISRKIAWPILVITVYAAGCTHGAALAPTPGGPVSGPGLVRSQPMIGMASSPDRRTGPPEHVLTWLILDAPGGPNLDPSQVAQWVDYTMTTQAPSQQAHQLGMKTIMYTDPNRTRSGDLMHTNDESTYAHDCNGNRIQVLGKDKQLMNVYSSHLWNLWPQAVKTMMGWGGGGVYDYIFEDTADSVNGIKLSAMPCNFDQNGWTNNTNSMDSHLGYAIIYNGLAHIPSGSSSPAPAIGLNPTASGGMGEDCYVGRTPTGYHYAPNWLGMENTELQMQAQNDIFICHGDAYVKASTNDALRTYFYASFLLSYDLSRSVVNTEFLTPSEVTVMPEAQLVPEAPLKPTPSTVDGLKEPSGVYGREYASCYLAGQLIGACAVAVNPTNPGQGPPLAYPWPGKYTHTLTMSGAGVYDGGTVGTHGPAPPSKMAGGTAVIAFP